MNNKSMLLLRIKQSMFLYLLFVGMSASFSQADTLGGQVPQIPAFLPMAHTVPQTEALPIDGEWVVTSIGKRIRIQGGRAFAVDPWVHLFVLKIQPLMVVLKNIQRTGPGQYSGEDLPLMGKFDAMLDSSGNLNVRVAGALGPAQYVLAPVSQDDPRAFTAEKNGNYTPGGDQSRDDGSDEDDGSNEHDDDEGTNQGQPGSGEEEWDEEW